MHLTWLRSDLRINDNTALSAASERGPTIALWLVSPAQWLAHDDAACKVDFWLRNLRDVRQSLEGLNIPLLIRSIDTWDQAPQAVLEVCRQHRVASVHWNEEYGINEQRRDDATRALLEKSGIQAHSHLDQLFFRPGTVLTRSGDYFQVFSQFKKTCLEHLHRSLPAMAHRVKQQAPLQIQSDPIPQHVEGFEKPERALQAHWPAGEAEAQGRLSRFLDETIDDYQQLRDLPAKPGTSQLSAYLAAGVISPRQCLHGALASNRGEFDSGSAGVQTWINELLWREFYKHILTGFPQVSRHRAFRAQTEALPWRDAPADLEAWEQGRTGFPIIDAAMRQLLHTGWMHNRLRMVVAMFLSKNLLIDWRKGERYFMRHLIDGDLAANNGGWQWSASTGTDAVPYFRIFNPISQSQRFDPQGRFIRHWLPELRDLDDKTIHEPVKHRDLFDNNLYHCPMVNLSSSRQRALEAFKGLPRRQN
ncbi:MULTISPECIES: deoxyribodipyrimidine photo-lyase [Pseudomonas]|jgi:deoxyribodipyrimidine photo-lyase|uniref:Deoxyribodipyrimidine photo-lyase n=1 Tax=Pseudomonas monteilii TaxID=76759 RepID=A0AAE6R8D9_9PSED|nr:MULTISPECIES: deoxyribodipyrimidine photo-lyase [Pseudomonas]MBB3270886.1 deoxyribodipyrimidine photo-lyase [Pseudomonas sp. OG7]MBH3393304.1 deoxyribodipyrimidine photo-lyase [Pseudomonas monteilii]MDI3372510.1 deoxyribodipyrimidine photo-lyase [Pseudomonas sp. V104_10]NBB07250.1 deoxyribodipyrimidine photo-lyase [Pseudomonas monteilii]QHB26072.1 deoxyribodipyrimidine photo-lyase [Pseudomonas monteilii]